MRVLVHEAGSSIFPLQRLATTAWLGHILVSWDLICATSVNREHSPLLKEHRHAFVVRLERKISVLSTCFALAIRKIDCLLMCVHGRRFVELKASTTCIDCSVGSYAGSGSSACIDCPPNSNNVASLSGATQIYHSILDCKCNVGFLGHPDRNEPCLPASAASCTVNEYLHAGECRPCPADMPLSAAGSVGIGSCKTACTREVLRQHYFDYVGEGQSEGVELYRFRDECSWKFAAFAHQFARTFRCRYLQHAAYLCAKSHGSLMVA